MNKIIKMTDEEIVVGKEDGSVLKVNKSTVSWDAKVGDIVDIFIDGDETILSLSEGVQKKKCNFLQCLINGCQKVLPIVFSSLVGLFLILTIVFCAIPRGNKYYFSQETSGILVETEISFSDKKMIVKNSYRGLEDETKFDYKIEKGKLLYFSKSEQKFMEYGSINSTKIVVTNYDNSKLVFVEKGMFALKTISIVFLVITAILDALCVTVLILTKKGIIKLETKKSSEEPKQNLQEEASEKE